MNTQTRYEIIHSGNRIDALSTSIRQKAFESYTALCETFPKDTVMIEEIINIKNIIAQSDDHRQYSFNFDE
jgi:hypothetical protein